MKGEGAEAVRALKAEEGKDVYVFGSADQWAAVENLLLSYDELGPAMTVVRNV